MAKGEPGAAPQSYDLVAKTLHWVIAGLVLYLILASDFDDRGRTAMSEALASHAGLGLVVWVLAVIRLAWTASHPKPGRPAGVADWEHAAALWVHRAFYVLLLAQPLVGLVTANLMPYAVSAFGLLPVDGLIAANEGMGRNLREVHEFLANLMLVLILLHAAAALRHQFIKKNGVLGRMVPFLRG